MKEIREPSRSAWYRSEETVDAGGIGVEFEKRAMEMGAVLEDHEGQGQLLEADGEVIMPTTGRPRSGMM